jgi:hypothetical protein
MKYYYLQFFGGNGSTLYNRMGAEYTKRISEYPFDNLEDAIDEGSRVLEQLTNEVKNRYSERGRNSPPTYISFHITESKSDKFY